MTFSSPEFIDNLDGNKLAAAVRRVLIEEIAPPEAGMAAKPAHFGWLDVASAFFLPAGFARIAGALDGLKYVRLMIGAEAPAEARPSKRPFDELDCGSSVGCCAKDWMRETTECAASAPLSPYLRRARVARGAATSEPDDALLDDAETADATE